MKVADGFWLNQRGYEVSYATQPYEIKVENNSVNVLATTQHIRNRGMTLGGPVLEMTFSSTRENIIKVNICHYKGGLDNAP
ncbi:MAG: alpha-xylosidase, partial [Oscillospiraceae bacterium]|nr:alpha-xylosidase [Oscillospiraceae bacterium]